MAENLQAYLDRVLGPKDYASNYRGKVFHDPVLEVAHRQQILKDVQSHHGAGRLHIGAAGFFNFDIVAKGKHDACVLVDINPDQIAFWKTVFRWIADSKNLDELEQNFTQHGSRYFAGIESNSYGPITNMDFKRFIGDCRWAFDEGEYAHIRNLVTQQRVAAVQLDAYDEPRCNALNEAIRAYENGLYHVDTVYGSNIHEIGGPKILPKRMGTIYQHIIQQLKPYSHEPSDVSSVVQTLMQPSELFDEGMTQEQAETMVSSAVKVLHTEWQRERTAWVARRADALINVISEDDIQRALAEEMLQRGREFHVSDRNQARAYVRMAREELLRNPEAAEWQSATDMDTRNNQFAAEFESVLRRNFTHSDYDQLHLIYQGTDKHTRGYAALGDGGATVYLARIAEFRDPVTRIHGGAVRERFAPDHPQQPETIIGR